MLVRRPEPETSSVIRRVFKLDVAVPGGLKVALNDVKGGTAALLEVVHWHSLSPFRRSNVRICRE
jgi:hypothetical protein